MLVRQSLIGIVLWLVLVSVTVADETTAPPAETVAAKQASAVRLWVMRRRAMSLTVETESKEGEKSPAKIIETPLLRYSNLAAEIVTADATVWAWGQTGRPVALASLDKGGLEIVSLSETPVSLSGKSGLAWASAKSDIVWKKVPDAPQPASSAALRSRQMKELSKRFTATGHYGDSGDYQLRLLERPLHRYSDPERQIQDGAIFALVAGTNPEVIVLFECREAAGKGAQWYYGVTRLSAGRLVAKLDDREVWTCDAISKWNPRDPYWSGAFGMADNLDETELPQLKQP